MSQKFAQTVTTSLAESIKFPKIIFVPLKFKFILKIFMVIFPSFFCFMRDPILIYILLFTDIKVLINTCLRLARPKF